MIREFSDCRRILFFPVRWANAVARWIAGVHSKTGTVRVTNTLTPGSDGSVSLDVDMDAVTEKVKVRLGFDRESPMTRIGVRDTLFDLVDGASIINSGRRISVSTDWLAEMVASQIPSGTSYATQSWVTGQLENYATTSTTDTISGAVEDLSDIVDGIVANYLTSSDLDGYATQTWVGQQGYLTSATLTGYATQTWVGQQGYLTSSDLDGYATQTWVGQQGYLTSATLTGYATTTALNNGLAGKSNTNHTHPKTDLTDFDTNVKALIPDCYESGPTLYNSVSNLHVMFYIPSTTAGCGTVAYGDVSNVFATKSHTHTSSQITDFATSVDTRITSQLSSYATQSWVSGQLGNYATTSTTDTISGAVEDLSDVVDGIVANYLTSSDLDGYATQTWVGQQGYLTSSDLDGYATSEDLADYVDTSTAQTVRGMKTFVDSMRTYGEIRCQANNGTSAGVLHFYDMTAMCPSGASWFINFYKGSETAANCKGMIGCGINDEICLKGTYESESGKDGVLRWSGTKLRFPNGTCVKGDTNGFTITSTGSDAHADYCMDYIELYTSPTAIHGGYIDFHFAGSSADYTSRLIDSEDAVKLISLNKGVELVCTGTSSSMKINLHAAANNSVLTNAPTVASTNTSSKAIATCGWVADGFISNTQIGVSGGVAAYSHPHTADQITDFATSVDTRITSQMSSYATKTWVGQQGYLTSSDLDGYVTTNDLGTTIDDKITTYSNTASQTYATLTSFNSLDDEVGEISDAVIDLSDAYDALDEDLTTVETWKSTGIASLTINVVTEVTWNGTSLQYKKRSLTFANGILTAAGTESTTTIDTPSVVTWS